MNLRGKNGAKYKGYWFLDGNKKIFKVEYFHEMPIAFCRFIRVNNQIYGESSGTLAISSIKILNHVKGDAIDNIEREINEDLRILCTIHMDPIVTNDETVNELRAFTVETVKEICPEATIHDFRTVIGQTHTNLIFDLVLPFDLKEEPAMIVESIKSAIKDRRSYCFCVITVDRA